MKHGEMQVGLLAESIGLGQSALSQHLARLRADGLVGTRRDAQAIYYRIVDKRVGKLLKALETII
jgi:DNA-binding transcriptional ArsR family regulator